MSLLGELTHENHQMEAEVQEDDEADSEMKSNEDVQVNEVSKSSQTEKRANSPLTLLRDDFIQFTEGLKKKFIERDTNPKMNKLTEKQVKPATLFKEDLNQLKESLSSVFRIGVPKERENKDEAVKEDDNNSRVKPSKSEGAEELFRNLFRWERPLLQIQTAKDVKEVEKSNNGLDVRSNLTKQNEEQSNAAKNHVNRSTNCEMIILRSESQISQTQQSENFASKTAAQKLETEDRKEDFSIASGDEEEPLTSVSSNSLNSGIDLFPLTNDLRDQQTEELWSPKNYATYLTLDPNTANYELQLTDRNRTATRDWLNSGAPQSPDRFEQCPQVLCREGLLDPVYWEVEWSGGADIGVTYYSISRDADAASCLLGHNEWSWSLECSEGIYTPCHDKKRFKSSSPEPFTHRIGVFLNYPEKELCFYCISRDTMVHLHTFKSNFTEPLYPGFWVWSSCGSVNLCQVELDWERLLQ